MANEQQPKSKQGDLLSSFLGSVDGFMEKLSAQAAAAAPEGNERIIIQSTGDAIISQTKKLTNYIRQIVAPLTPVQRRELDAFMRIQDGDAMANRAIEISAKVLASPGNGLTMNFLSWLQENVHTLKKIILATLALLGKI